MLQHSFGFSLNYVFLEEPIEDASLHPVLKLVLQRVNYNHIICN